MPRAGWQFYNIKRRILGLTTHPKQVQLGDQFGSLIALTEGRAMKRVYVLCECGRFGKYTAASLTSGNSKVCDECEKRSGAWVAKKKWVNPKPLSKDEVVIMGKLRSNSDRKSMG